MKKVIEYEDIECQECCLICEEDKNKCEYRKQRGRAVDRWIYKTRKEYEQNQG